MADDLSWIVMLLAVLLMLAFLIEVYVIVLIAGFLATFFGFSGILWWACAIMMFIVINGVIGLVFKM